MTHFIAILSRNAGTVQVRIAHFFYFSHIMHRLPPLSETDYRLYDLFRSYKSHVEQIEQQQPDILIAPHGTLLQLAYDKLADKLKIQPKQVYSRRSEKVVQGGEPQTVQERTARRANAVILFNSLTILRKRYAQHARPPDFAQSLRRSADAIFHGGCLLAAPCEKGQLHLQENQYFFEIIVP